MILRYNFFTIIWGILIIVFTLSPAGTHTIDIYGKNFDIIAHGILFFIFGFLLTVGLSKQYTSTYIRFNSIKVSILVSNAFGILVECGQFLIPERGFQPWDLLANFIGTVVALLLFLIVYKL